MIKFLMLDVFIGTHEGRMTVILIDLAVAEHVGDVHDLLDKFYASGII